MFGIQDIILFCVVIASLAGGILLPRVGELFQPFILYLLMILLYLSFLSIRLDAIRRTFSGQARDIARLSILKLIAFPVATYLIFLLVAPAYAPSALLLAGSSTGAVAPFISTLVAANGPLVIAMVVISSLLVPFILPLLVKLIMGQTMEIPLAVMVQMLAAMIFIPLAASEATRRFLPGAVPLIIKGRYAMSLMLFTGTNMGVFSKYSDYFYSHPGAILAATGMSVLIGAVLFGMGIFSLGRASTEDRLAAAISVANINSVLIVVFAARFFGPLETMVAAMFLIPFYGLIVPLRIFQRRHSRG